MTFKENLYKICEDVVKEFPGWRFVAGRFENSLLKHTDLVIDPGLFFDQGFTNLEPSIGIRNKRCAALYAEIFEIPRRNIPVTSFIRLQAIAHLLVHMPEPMRLQCVICADKKPFLAAIHKPNACPEEQIARFEQMAVDIQDVRPVLIAMMRDGESLLGKLYDLSSEENLLRALPAKYATRHANSANDELEKQKGVMLCIVRILVGDFDYVERYRSDEFQTVFPKRVNELDKIVARMPELRKRFVEQGR
ncbi:hypothetical protein SAMN05443245_7580 [Paraburkholderia fungorum]|uniref:Uncharacterized protein n=1 Tax=Paraburkholderia fungorum TaxID=134537 RepID=A0A1H1JZI6_9BURK|nr:hypothetical protein [Paraburkholderia fungorum]SDR55057.1 hypothetical protein SAMN05443245_7580 [Paraburkholderia fungorum]